MVVREFSSRELPNCIVIANRIDLFSGGGYPRDMITVTWARDRLYRSVGCNGDDPAIVGSSKECSR
jgi:hypothetical protein